VLALFIWGFALYGLFVALWKLARLLLQRTKRGVPVTAVLIVKEGASYIEGILRTLTTAAPFTDRELTILVIDCQSRDETTHIVEAISHKRGSITLLAATDDPYSLLTSYLHTQAHTVQCVFDLRGGCSPLDVVPTLAAFWERH